MTARFDPAAIRFVLFDLAGTTVRDGRPGESLVVRALAQVLQRAGAQIPEDALAAERGRDHDRAIADLLREWRPVPAVTAPEVSELCALLNQRLLELSGEMTEVPGAADTFRFLRAYGIGVGVGSGFPRPLIDAIVGNLGWEVAGLLDYVESTATLGAGRPDPRMVRDVMARFGIADARQVLKVGDTVVDVQEGRNAGAWTVSVLTGTQGRAVLEAAGPDFILESVAALPALFADGGGG